MLVCSLLRDGLPIRPSPAAYKLVPPEDGEHARREAFSPEGRRRWLHYETTIVRQSPGIENRLLLDLKMPELTVGPVVSEFRCQS